MLKQEKRLDFIIIAALMLPVGWLFKATRRMRKRIEEPEPKVVREYIVLREEDLIAEMTQAPQPVAAAEPQA
jgi:hypothetical protein